MTLFKVEVCSKPPGSMWSNEGCGHKRHLTLDRAMDCRDQHRQAGRGAEVMMKLWAGRWTTIKKRLPPPEPMGAEKGSQETVTPFAFYCGNCNGRIVKSTGRTCSCLWRVDTPLFTIGDMEAAVRVAVATIDKNLEQQKFAQDLVRSMVVVK